MKVNKKAIEMSFNTIVIVVIALVFLGLAIGLIKNWTGKIENQIPKVFPPNQALWPPTAENPLAIVPSNIDMRRGETKTFSFEFYNYLSGDLTCNIDVAPGDQASSDKFKFIHATTNRAIDSGMVGHWDIGVTSANNVENKAYLFTINAECGQISKESDFFIEIK